MALVGTRPKGLCVRTLFLKTFLLSVILGLWLTELYALEMAETIEQWTKGGRLEGTEKVPLMINKFIVSCGWTGAPFWLTLTTLLVLILPFVWQFFFSPLNQSKLLEDTEAAPSDLRKRRLRAGNQLPSPYPTGWFCVKVQADEIKHGQIEEIQLFGHTFALYRGWDGKVRMMDAFCTHLGASLAIGGTVQPTSNCLRCPFHGWEFDGSSGRCISIPYGDHGSSQSGEECRPPASSSSSSIKDKVSSSSSSSSSLSSIPKQAHSRAWPVVEAQNMVYVYYDETWARSEDKKSLDEMETEFECPVINELNTPGHDRFVYHGHSVHQVAAHIQEIPENGADVAHLNILHKNFILKALSPLITHIWTADWVAGKRDEGTGHQAFIHLTQKLQCFNGRFDIPGTLIDVTITQDGPGIVYLFFQTPVGRLYVMETVTPISPMVQQATHTMWAERHVPRIVAKIVLWSLVKQFERDIPIWNNKTFLRKPTIVKGDGPITKFRHWYAQFYPDTSLLPPPPACTLDW